MTIDDRKELKKLFDQWLDIQDQKKELAEFEKELKDKAASYTGIKKGIIGKLFNVMKSKINGATETDVEQVYSLMAEMTLSLDGE